MKNRNILGCVIFCVLVCLDQISKYAAVLALKGKEAIPIIKNVFELEYVENRGAAFGIMQNKQCFFIAITVIIVIILFFVSFKMPKTKKYLPLYLCDLFLCAGAIGNLIDRIKLNYVVDFLYFKLIDFPVFNVADCYVTVSVAVLALLIFFYYKDEDLELLKQSLH